MDKVRQEIFYSIYFFGFFCDLLYEPNLAYNLTVIYERSFFFITYCNAFFCKCLKMSLNITVSSIKYHELDFDLQINLNGRNSYVHLCIFTSKQSLDYAYLHFIFLCILVHT